MTAVPPDTDPPGSVHLGDSHDPLVIRLAGDAGWEEVRAELVARLSADPARYHGVRAHLDLGDRDIELYDLRRLAHSLEADHGVLVVALRCSTRSLRRYAERELKLKVLEEPPPPESPEPPPLPEPTVAEPPPPPPPAPPPLPEDAPDVPEAVRVALGIEIPPAPPATEEPEGPASRVQVIHRTLRSGTSIRFGGDVVVFGDVHAGAQIVASGSVVVLGALLGLAHAGARGDDDAFVLALELDPTQIRIGSRIAIPPQAPAGSSPRGAEIAFVREDRIVIEPYRGRLPSSSAQRSVE